MNRKPKLPKYLYWRGDVIWLGIKNAHGKWINKSTGFRADQLVEARRLRDEMLTQVPVRQSQGLTVRRYMLRWTKERSERGVRSAQADKKKLEKHLGTILDMSLDEVRTFHVRDEVRALKKRVNAKEMAPRTALHIYEALHNMFENAVADELIPINPVRVKPGELPQEVDKDPEWRELATYQRDEVMQLISDARIPAPRRVQYAMKALAGMRHGEVAAICWRHYDATISPLGRINITQAFDSIESEIKDTKTGCTRVVPVHPELARILEEWRIAWAAAHGREPTPDDFIVPTSAGTCVAAQDAGKALKRDFDTLGLRKEAGKYRARGGHDLRSWFITQAIEDGADYMLVRRTTHAPPRDTEGGYQRFSWRVYCREVAKLQLSESVTPTAHMT